MIEVDLHIYMNALFILMFTSITAFIVIVYKMHRSNPLMQSLKFYSIYFILGMIGWLGLWIKDSLKLNLDLSAFVIFYILVSCFLFIATIEKAQRKYSLIIVCVVHLLICVVPILIDTDINRITFVAFYTLVIYPAIFYTSLLRAVKENNIGYGIICIAALIVIIIAPIQLYSTLTVIDPGFAYGISIIGSSSGFVLVGIGFLTSILINKQNELIKLTLNDPLTGLYNRRGMTSSLTIPLAEARRHNRCVSVIAIDIDHFKDINDTYGHSTGDYVLTVIAGILKNHARSSDISCRLGGEEFTIISPETDMESAIIVAERIRRSIEALHISFDEHSGIKLTSSFGVSTYRGNVDINILLRDADKALYQAKHEGRNRVCATG